MPTSSDLQVFGTLASAGIAVYAGDAFGHGKSEGDRALIQNFNDVASMR